MKAFECSFPKTLKFSASKIVLKNKIESKILKTCFQGLKYQILMQNLDFLGVLRWAFQHFFEGPQRMTLTNRLAMSVSVFC